MLAEVIDLDQSGVRTIGCVVANRIAMKMDSQQFDRGPCRQGRRKIPVKCPENNFGAEHILVR
jgi:hypothetical protein